MSRTNHLDPLIDVFSEFHDREISYVVPRKHDLLRANEVPKSDDVDIIIWDKDYENAIEICRNYEFSTTATFPERIQTLASRAIAEPRTAIDLLIDSPKQVLTLIFSDSINPYNHRNDKLYSDNLMLDIRNGLAYRSPMDGTRIRVDPAVDKGLFERRREVEKVFVP